VEDTTAVLVTEADLAAPRVCEAAGGHACVWSSPAPDRDGANQDAAAVFALPGDRAVLAVADGMGGRPAGATASGTVLRALEAALSGLAEGEPVRGAVLDAVEAAHDELLAAGVGAATTLVVAEIDGARLRPYHAGDSAILAVGQRGRLKLRSLSHSPVGYAVEAGVLDEDEALHHPERHLVSNAVGLADLRVEMGTGVALGARDTVLLATDGLLDNLALEEVVETVRRGPLERAGGSLHALARERMLHPVPGRPSKPDDLTFVLWRRRPAARARRR
jgi:serine/threonine protein phosphatase PrpC